MYEYLSQHEGFNHQNKLRIPCFVFPFAVKEEEQRKTTIKTVRDKSPFWLNRSSSLGRINPFDALKPGNAHNFQELLMAKIKENE
jgi:hypothetical protein